MSRASRLRRWLGLAPKPNGEATHVRIVPADLNAITGPNHPDRDFPCRLCGTFTEGWNNPRRRNVCIQCVHLGVVVPVLTPSTPEED